LSPSPDHRLAGFNFNVEEWFESDHYETLSICRTLALCFDRVENPRATRRELLVENCFRPTVRAAPLGASADDGPNLG